MKVSTHEITPGTWKARIDVGEGLTAVPVNTAMSNTQDSALSILQHKLEAAVEAVKEARAELKLKD